MAHPRRLSPELILRAARASLEAHGALSQRDIAARLSVRPPSLYEYFPSLEALKAELIRAGFLMLGEELRSAVARDASLVSLGTAYRAFAARHPRLYHLMREPGTGTVRGHAIARFVIQPIADVLRMDVDDPEFLDISRQLWSYVHGFVTLEQAGQFFAGGDTRRAFVNGLRRLAATFPPRPRRAGD